jgi:hypothetical protein
MASKSGIVIVAGQKVALGRSHVRKTVTIDVAAEMLHIECDDGVRTVRRTTDLAVRQIKPQRSRKVTELEGPHVKDQPTPIRDASVKPRHAARPVVVSRDMLYTRDARCRRGPGDPVRVPGE